jgi:hypothetical protein
MSAVERRRWRVELARLRTIPDGESAEFAVQDARLTAVEQRLGLLERCWLHVTSRQVRVIDALGLR